MPVSDEDVAELFHGAYTVLVERAPEAPTFDEITSPLPDMPALPDRPANGRQFDGASSQADLPVFELRRQDRASQPVSSKRLASIVFPAVAAVLLLVVGIVVAVRDQDGVSTNVASSPGPAEPTASAPVAEPGTPLWPLLSFEDGTGFMGVVAAGPGFVAVGERDGKAAVWTSVDGLTWSPVPHDEAVFGGEGGSAMADVTVGGPGLVAVGSHGICTDLPVLEEDGSTRVDEVGVPEGATICSDGNAAVWTSTDGVTWSRVPHDEAVFGGPDFYQMNSVVAAGPGLVAVGRSDDFGGGAVLVEGESVVDVDAVVWTSTDGVTWSRVPHDEAVFGGPDWQSMSDVTVGGPGLVAVGQDGGRHFWGNSPDDRPGVWTSADGLRWTKIPDDEDAFGTNSTMLGITAGGPGLVAVGHGGGGVARVWISTDGFSWSRVTHDNPEEMRGFMWDVAMGSPGLTAVGCCEEPAQVWTSTDGLTWSPAPDLSVPEPGQ